MPGDWCQKDGIRGQTSVACHLLFHFTSFVKFVIDLHLEFFFKNTKTWEIQNIWIKYFIDWDRQKRERTCDYLKSMYFAKEKFSRMCQYTLLQYRG